MSESRQMSRLPQIAKMLGQLMLNMSCFYALPVEVMQAVIENPKEGIDVMVRGLSSISGKLSLRKNGLLHQAAIREMQTSHAFRNYSFLEKGSPICVVSGREYFASRYANLMEEDVPGIPQFRPLRVDAAASDVYAQAGSGSVVALADIWRMACLHGVGMNSNLAMSGSRENVFFVRDCKREVGVVRIWYGSTFMADVGQLDGRKIAKGSRVFFNPRAL